jgi:hypothetical protein
MEVKKGRNKIKLQKRWLVKHRVRKSNDTAIPRRIRSKLQNAPVGSASRGTSISSLTLFTAQKEAPYSYKVAVHSSAMAENSRRKMKTITNYGVSHISTGRCKISYNYKWCYNSC